MSLLALSAQTAAEPWPADDVGAAVRGVFAVAIVLALVVVLAWLVRRGVLPFGPSARGQAVRIESSVPLGERRSLVIVTVEGRRLLLGLTPSQVSLVSELGTAPFQEALEARLDADAPEARS
ncbi:MAG: flagellar biosynthetic protein FliO [Vicinamibacterales bacterium]|nr:flagellar biosynthetic protein FliO [Vicinamibacterales bacterium]